MTRAEPREGSIAQSLTSYVQFATCRHCGETISRERSGRTNRYGLWVHRYMTGQPRQCGQGSPSTRERAK